MVYYRVGINTWEATVGVNVSSWNGKQSLADRPLVKLDSVGCSFSGQSLYILLPACSCPLTGELNTPETYFIARRSMVRLRVAQTVSSASSSLDAAVTFP